MEVDLTIIGEFNTSLSNFLLQTKLPLNKELLPLVSSYDLYQ